MYLDFVWLIPQMTCIVYYTLPTTGSLEGHRMGAATHPSEEVWIVRCRVVIEGRDQRHRFAYGYKFMGCC